MLINIDDHVLMTPLEFVEGKEEDPVAIITRIRWSVIRSNSTFKEHCPAPSG